MVKLEMKVHNVKVGDWVLVNTWKDKPLMSKWEGPYQVLLTTELAVQTQYGWAHHTRVKLVPPPEKPEGWNIQGTYPRFKLIRQQT